MYQIDNPTAATAQPASTSEGTPGFFTDGNPAGGIAATVLPAEYMNSVMMELLNVLDAAGIAPVKNAFNQLAAAIKAISQNQLTGLIGGFRNAAMSVTAASSTATFTADLIVVGTALNGTQYVLPSFNETVNLATVGAGGMDSGAAPDSGFVALYAIYNPTTAAVSILATNATTAIAPTIYAGGHMPAGYTASALISVWPTTSSGQFALGLQTDRNIAIAGTTILNTSTVAAANTPISITAVPKNARTITMNVSVTSTSASSMSISMYSLPNNIGQLVNNQTVAAGVQSENTFSKLPISIPQTIYYGSTSSAGTPTFAVAASSFDF